MKKIIIILLFLFFIVEGKAQAPITQTIGSPSTDVRSRGVSSVDSSFTLRTSFADTAAANRGWVKNISGTQIRVGDTIYMRNVGATAWIKQTGGSSTTGQRFGVTGEDDNNSVFNANRTINMSLNAFIWDSLSNYFLRSYRAADSTNVNFTINHTTRTMSMQTGNARWQTFYKQNWSDATGSIVFIEANKTTSSSNTAHIQLAGIDTSIQLAGEKISIMLDTSHTSLAANAGLFISSAQLKWSSASTLNSLYMDTVTGEVFRGENGLQNWQQTLDVGSTLDKNNTIQGGNTKFIWYNMDTVSFNGTGSSSRVVLAVDTGIFMYSGLLGNEGASVIRTSVNKRLQIMGGETGEAIHLIPNPFGGSANVRISEGGSGNNYVSANFYSSSASMLGQIGLDAAPAANDSLNAFYLKAYVATELDIYHPFVFEMPVSSSTSDSVLVKTASGEVRTRAQSDISGGGSGTVTDFVFTDANGFDGTVTNSTTTPALSLTTTVTNTQLMYSNSGAVTGDANITRSGAGAITVGTSITSPLIIGGTGTTSDLILRTTSGVGASGADMIFQVGNNGATTAMTILNDGKVGIGDTGPVMLLSVAGSVAFGTTEVTNYNVNIYGTTTSYMTLNTAGSGTTSTDGFQFGLEATGNYFIGRENIPSIFYTNNSEKMRLDADGDLGIGNAAPVTKLHLGTAGTSSGTISITGSTSGTISLLPQNAAGTYNWNWPTSSGNSGEALVSGGGGSTAMTWLAIAGSTTTPTGTAGTNVDAVTPYPMHWTRVGSTVAYSFAVDIDATVGSGSAIVEISLPVASNFAATTNANGVISEGVAPSGTSGWVVASVANDRLVLTVTATTTAARTYFVSGTYTVL